MANKKKNKGKSDLRTIKVDPTIHDRVKKRVVDTKQTVTQFANEALTDKLKKS